MVDETPWVQPIPAKAGAGISLAYVMALQALTPMQRAIVTLCDQAGYSIDEAAAMLDIDVAAAADQLEFARMNTRTAPDSGDEQPFPFVVAQAFASSRVAAVRPLLADDVRFCIPSIPFHYRGIRAVCGVLHSIFSWGHTLELIEQRANGQLALAEYGAMRDRSTRYGAGLLVLSCHKQRLSGITRFDSSELPRFGIPRRLPVHEDYS